MVACTINSRILLLTKPPTRASEAFCFYGFCRQDIEPMSGLEPLTCSSYEFACTRSSPSWCVRHIGLEQKTPPPAAKIPDA
jgi:hypothetical protein